MGTPLTTDDLRKIDQIEQMAAIQPTDMLVAQRPNAAAGRITAAQMAGYAADTYNVSVTCATAAASEYKDVTITGAVVPQTLAVTFTNANTFGDSTASTATYPKLRVYGTGQTLLTTLDICDSRGHTAGTGCWNAGDVILFRIIGTKALISNSDVRQSDDTAVITADGKEKYRSQIVTNEHVNGRTNSVVYVASVPLVKGNRYIISGYLDKTSGANYNIINNFRVSSNVIMLTSIGTSRNIGDGGGGVESTCCVYAKEDGTVELGVYDNSNDPCTYRARLSAVIF